MLATVATQDLIKISAKTKAALAKRRAAGIKLGTPNRRGGQIEQIYWLKGGAWRTMSSAKRCMYSQVCWLGEKMPQLK